jgi:hypothetical protein
MQVLISANIKQEISDVPNAVLGFSVFHHVFTSS